MAPRIFNTLTRRIEEFVPLDQTGRKVGMYCCGPTVYDFGHIGNFRTFVFADLVRRFLEFRGFDVSFVMNITDVEDKIIRRVRSSGQALRDYTSKFENAFWQDLETLSCLKPHAIPRATDHLEAIVELIQRLMERGIAYRTADGSVYFSIEKYQSCGGSYGKLQKLDFERMRPGARVDQDEYDKASVADFALWKARVADDGEVYWTSPWGEGRPGWHIECSAMSMKHLGPSFDLHLGGEDLIFPHHEDEIAQSEGANLQSEGKPFVKYWMHGAHLLVEGKKMSKSLGNFFTLRDLLEQGFGGREIRYLLLSAHYRETFNFTLKGLQDARTSLARLDECVGKVEEAAGGDLNKMDVSEVLHQGLVEAVGRALDEDLNVALAWGAVFDWVRATNRKLADKSISQTMAADLLREWRCVDTVLGLGKSQQSKAIPANIQALAEERRLARKAKDFQRSDEIRDRLKSMGWIIEDTADGPKVKPI